MSNRDISDGLIDKWAEEAMDDLSAKGWRDIDPNSMMLIIYRVQRGRDRKLVSKITRPMWWLLGAVGAGVIWWIMSSLIGIPAVGGG